ncbi:MAG: phage tail sheath C-terminal domain-containing protein [Chthoniobacteraceae bacterium]
MPEQFLHGVEVIEVTSGPKPIQTVSSSIIGIIGTAPDSPTLSTGTVSDNNALTFTSKLADSVTDSITIELKDPKTNSATLSVAVSAKVITVSLATDATGAITSTAANVTAAINASIEASALVSVANTGASTGAGAVLASSSTALSSTVAKAFPLNTPTLISGSVVEAAKLGSKGTLPAALTDILNQIGAAVVVVRVAEGSTDAETQTNVIGGVSIDGSYTGMSALLGAEHSLGVRPRILIAPGFTSHKAVLVELATIAEKLRAVFFADGPNTSDADAFQYFSQFGYERGMAIDPYVLEGTESIARPSSAIAAGLQALSDNNRGFWWTLSNQEINGITGTTRPIDFTFGDTNCRANLLNASNIATIINVSGYRFWGNRSMSGDFLCVRRTADIIEDSILRAHLWAVDRMITKTYLDDVSTSVNAYLRTLRSEGAIIDGKCWADTDLNTPANIAEGKVYFNFDFTPPYPAEHVTFTSIITNDYLEELTK